MASKKYISMLTLEECCTVFNYWIADNLKATTQLQIKKHSNNQVKATFKVGTEHCTATIRPNYNEFGYCDAVLMAYYKGHATPTHIKRAVEDVGGPSRDTNEWLSLSFERWKNIEKDLEPTQRKAKERSPEEVQAEHKANEERIKLAEFETNKSEYLERLPGATVAQYTYLAAKALQDPIHHEKQMVKTPETHPYNIRKGFGAPEDFLIMPNHIPKTSQIIQFLESDKFRMPKNDYGFTKDDIINKIKDPATDFKISDYITEHDLKNGVGLLPSMDVMGAVTNVQKFLPQPLHDGVDKIFMKQAIARDSYYVFGHQEKLGTDYNPKNIIITEGWATGMSIEKKFNSKVDNAMVVIAWNAGQLKNAVETFANQYPKSNIMIAADNDVKSFVYANEKTGIDLDLIKNTGIKCAIEAYATNPQSQNRISIITPNVDFINFDKKLGLSDFNDIDMVLGPEKFSENIGLELRLAAQRRKNGIPETAHLVDLYNSQAKHYAELHGIPLKGITPEGSLDEVKFVPEALIQKQKEVELQAEQKIDNAIDGMTTSLMNDFFRVEINDDIKTDFDRKLEESARIITQGRIEHPEVNNIVANTLAPTVNAPKEQPMVDPVALTAVLYQSHLLNEFSQLNNSNSKTEMLQILEQEPQTLNGASKIMQAMFDPTISEHIPGMIDKVIDQYKETPFYNDLNEIKSFINDDYIVMSSETMQFLKDTQREVSNQFILEYQHLGLDEEVAHKLLSQEISEKPIEMKREFFRELRDTLSTLGPSDQTWLQDVKNMLLESKSMAAQVEIQAPAKTAVKEEELSCSP